MTRKFKFSFNQARDFPRVWAVFFPDTRVEVNVERVVAEVILRSGFDKDAEWPDPKAWMEGEGEVEFVDGVAIITTCRNLP